MQIITAALLVILLAFPALSPAADPAAAPAPAASAAPSGTIRRIDLNRATLPEFIAVPGIGQVMAQHIVDLRHKKGKFSTVEELLEIKGIGPKTLAALEAYLMVEPAAAPAPAVSGNKPK